MSSMSRRQFLENSAKAGFVAGSAGFIAACGGSSSSSSTSSSVSPAKPKRGGTIHMGVTGGSSSDSFDPNLAATNPAYAGMIVMYEALTWYGNANVTVTNRLADELTPNKDATVWTIRLRPDLTFHNGQPLTADDVIYSLNRAVNPKSPGPAVAYLPGIMASGMKKLDKLTLSIPFAKPFAVLPEFIAGSAGPFMLPVGFDAKHPVGTGPFKFVSFAPGQQAVFARNEDYWNHPLPYVDHLIMTNYPDETSQVNALLAGQEDIISPLSAATLGTVTGAGKRVLISPGGGFNNITMRVDVAPFTDVRVRQAFRLAANREAIMNTVFGGHGTIGNDIFGIWSSDYDHSIPQRAHDPDQARSLLKAAGHDGLNVTLVTADAAQGVIEMSQVYAQQAAAAGINVKLNQTTPTVLFGPNFTKWPFAVNNWNYNPYLANVAIETLAGAPYSETHFDNPRYQSLYHEAVSTLDVNRRTELAHQMQMIDYTDGGLIIPLFPPVIDAYAPNVNGDVRSKTGGSVNLWDFEHLWFS